MRLILCKKVDYKHKKYFTIDFKGAIMHVSNKEKELFMKKFFREFKQFISRGSIMDLAVGVIIGSAFTAIVNALTKNILMPVINYVLKLITGGKGLSEVYTYLDKQYMVNEAGEQVIDLANSIYIDWGLFISAIINFILIALVIFSLLKFIMRVKGISKHGDNITKEEYKAYRKQGKSKEEIAAIDKKLGEEKKAAADKAAAEAAANSTEALLKDIREILKNK